MNAGTAGTGPYEGMTWDGRQWVGEPTEAAIAVRKSQPWVAGSVQPAQYRREDHLDLAVMRTARATEAVAWGVLSIVSGMAALLVGVSLGLNGSGDGGIVTLIGVAIAAAFALVSFVKLMGSPSLPPRTPPS